MASGRGDVAGPHARFAAGAGGVWVAGPSVIVKVDPVGRVVRRTDVVGVTGLAAGEQAVWVIDDLTGDPGGSIR